MICTVDSRYSDSFRQQVKSRGKSLFRGIFDWVDKTSVSSKKSLYRGKSLFRGTTFRLYLGNFSGDFSVSLCRSLDVELTLWDLCLRCLRSSALWSSFWSSSRTSSWRWCSCWTSWTWTDTGWGWCWWTCWWCRVWICRDL